MKLIEQNILIDFRKSRNRTENDQLHARLLINPANKLYNRMKIINKIIMRNYLNGNRTKKSK